MHHPTAFVTPVVEHWLEREIAQWAHHEESIRRPIKPLANALTTELHLAPFYDNIIFKKNFNTALLLNQAYFQTLLLSIKITIILKHK